MRSILLMKAIRGTPYRSAWRQTVSDCGSTPATASKTATAPSSTRRLRSTSTVKSTCPGVSMMLIACSRQLAVGAADSFRGGVKQRNSEFLRHAFPATLPGETDDPAPRQRQPALRADLDRNLVGRATDTPRLDLEQRGGVAKGQIEDLQRLLLGLLSCAAQRLTYNLLCGCPLPLVHHPVQ